MRVLVPVDGTGSERQAVDLAFDLFGGATIVLLHVINPAEAGFSTETAMPSFPDGWYEDEKERIQELFDEIEASATDSDVTVERRIELGKPARTIIETIDGEDIDHVVMGSHGRKGVSRILLGSVAETVVRRAEVPVTVL
jgi:nucleotide-binding universal stress UspA family protein